MSFAFSYSALLQTFCFYLLSHCFPFDFSSDCKEIFDNLIYTRLLNRLHKNMLNILRNFQYFEMPYSPRNFYDNFKVLQNQKKQKEFILGIIPDYLIITYNSNFTYFIPILGLYVAVSCKLLPALNRIIVTTQKFKKSILIIAKDKRDLKLKET